MDVGNIPSSAPVEAAISVQNKAMKSDEVILNKLYEGISQNPIRPAGLSTGHNLNVQA